MLRLNPNPVFRTLSACGPPSGEMVGGGLKAGEGCGGGLKGVCVCVEGVVGGDPLSRDPPL